MEARNLIPHNGKAVLYPHFFHPEEAQTFLEQLIDAVPWKQEPIRIFGKEIMQPRLTCWYSDPGISYSYSGIRMDTRSWIQPLLAIKERIEPVAGVKFTGALLNFYRNGSDSMGWHRDNERELGRNPTIGSVSFGANREFQMRDHATKSELISIQLEHGSLLVMSGESQHFWQHRVPKANKLQIPRLNITFRVIS